MSPTDPRPSGEYAAARVSYEAGALSEADLAVTPLAQFEAWYAAAGAAGLPEPNAMVVATVDADGLPSTRTVLLKQADARGFVFFTNLRSRKGTQVAATGRAALTFPWHPMQRQVSARGVVEPLPRDEVAAYFRSRPWGSRVGAWASRQSQPVASRGDLEARYAELAARWPDTGSPDDVPLPDHWGGYVVRPVEVDFWQGRPSRLHDRLVYVATGDLPRLDDAAGWRVERRQPLIARLRGLLVDPAPLRESPAYRRLWVGLSLGQVGQQLTVVAIGLQVYAITRSSFAVGLVGLFALVPLVVLGLYGGAIVDAHDRRVVAIAASVGSWVTALALAAQAWAGLRSVGLLYALVALQSAAYAVNNPARAAIVPSLVSRRNLPAANALHTLSFTLGAAIGPTLGGFVTGRWGVQAAYTVDAVTYLFALWGVFGLPSMPPDGAHGVPRRAGLASVLEGLRFLAGRPNLRMTFFVDLSAMVFAMPRAVFPAVGTVVLGGGATTAGALVSAIAVGSILAGLFSGPLGAVRRQGLAVVGCVVGWGLAIAAFGVCLLSAGGAEGVARQGVSPWLWPALGCLVAAGGLDAVSAVFRQTILQAATPDALRGRLQGVFIVVVAGGPRVGDLFSGTVGDLGGEWVAATLGGLLCVAAALLLARLQPRFVRYDARDPEP